MKKLFYIFALGLTLSMASCAPSEVDDIFDENPAVRIDNAVKNYTELLKSNGGRWNMKYFANGDEGGYNFMMLFKNGSVEISGKNYYTGDAFVQDESMWEVIADYGPVLTFNTYNEVFHLFSDPVPDGTGLGGDYEFIVMKAEENKITLRGKKTGITAVLERVTDNVTDQEFFAEVEANRAASFTTLVDTLYITTSTGYQFAAVGHNDEVWTIFPAAGDRAANIIDYPEIMNSMSTRNGIRFMEPLSFFTEYDPEAFIPQDFTIQEDGSLLAEDGVTRITAGPLSNVFAAKLNTFVVDKTDMGGDFKTYYENFTTGARAALRRTINDLCFTYFNIFDSRRFNRFAMQFKAASLSCAIFLDYTIVDDNTVSISFNPNAATPYNNNGKTYYNGVEQLRDFIAMLTSRQLSFKTDNVLRPTVLTMYDKANPENYFVLKMTQNANYVDESTIEY